MVLIVYGRPKPRPPLPLSRASTPSPVIASTRTNLPVLQALRNDDAALLLAIAPHHPSPSSTLALSRKSQPGRDGA